MQGLLSLPWCRAWVWARSLPRAQGSVPGLLCTEDLGGSLRRQVSGMGTAGAMSSRTASSPGAVGSV